MESVERVRGEGSLELVEVGSPEGRVDEKGVTRTPLGPYCRPMPRVLGGS